MDAEFFIWKYQSRSIAAILIKGVAALWGNDFSIQNINIIRNWELYQEEKKLVYLGNGQKILDK